MTHEVSYGEEGYYNIVGRLKDMIIRGGENIYPSDVEAFLYRHPDIVDVAVVGVPDPKYGEEVCAVIRLKEGASCDTDAIRCYCQGQISHYKIPRYVQVVDDFPMTLTGKVQMFGLQTVIM